MKIPDLLSPKDVMIDVRGSNKRLLLQEFAATAADQPRPARRSGSALPFEAGRSRIDRDRQRRSHPARPAAGSEAALTVCSAKLKAPVEFDAIDEQAVDIIFVLLLPAAAESGPLRRWWPGP